MNTNYFKTTIRTKLFFILMLLVACSQTDTPMDEKKMDEEDTSENPDNKPDDIASPANFYRFTTYQTTTADPFDVNMLFHVSDSLYSGVENLTAQDLLITEDDENSPVDESKATLYNKSSFNLTLKTALLIDVSSSIQTNFDELKIQLKDLIDIALPYQEIAIYSFSSTTTLELDYTTDKEQLKTTIDNLQVGTSSTDFYGSVTIAANSFTNGFENLDVNVGNLIIFTDGDDTQASSTFSKAKETITHKNVYVVGLSSEDLDEDNIKNLVGNSFYYPSENLNAVDTNFSLIQTEIEHFANSVYLLNYETPKRGDNNHFLKVFHKENSNDTGDQFAVGEFVSSGFYEPQGPSAAVLISPKSDDLITITNQCNVEIQIGRSIDPDVNSSNLITYQLLFGTSENNLELVNEISVPASELEINIAAPSRLIPDTQYYWQIRTLDNDYVELNTLSDVSTFTFKESIFSGGDLTIYSQSEIDSFCYNSVQGKLTVIQSDTEINNLEGLDILRNIEDYLIIINTNVSNLDGLQNLQQVGSLIIQNNPLLQNINSIGPIVQIQDLQINVNNSLIDLQGLESVTNLGFFSVRYNDSLESLNGLENITNTSVNNMNLFSYNSRIEGNISLDNFCALNNSLLPSILNIKDNKYDPTWDDIQIGNCKL